MLPVPFAGIFGMCSQLHVCHNLRQSIAGKHTDDEDKLWPVTSMSLGQVGWLAGSERGDMVYLCFVPELAILI